MTGRISIFTVLTAVHTNIFGCGAPVVRPVDDPVIRTIGVPVRSVNWVRLHEGRFADGRPAVLATMGQNAENLFVLRIDPGTGDFSQYHSSPERSNYPTATCMSRSGVLYIGAAYAGHLLAFDPDAGALDDLGAINPGKASFPCGIVEDENGVLWIGSYGACDLTSYDPATGAFTRHGRMDDTDMYLYPAVNADGFICSRVMMTRPHLVVFDPRTGEKRTVGPVTTKNEDTFALVQDASGRVYIRSGKGNFRIEGFEAVPVDTVPDPAPRPSKHGLAFSFTDAGEQLYRTLRVKAADGPERTFELDYRAAGNDIFCLHRGPDGLLYGSSILPEHFFRFDPAQGGLDDLGRCSASTGEAYSMANLGGSIYIASYPGARVSVYDPLKPYRYGDDPDANPRELGRIDDISYRPRSALAGPLGKVWFASVPDYGVWGGPLSRYDPATGEKHAHYRIAGDASCYTLAHLPGENALAVGTTVSGGSGTTPKVDRATLFLWDYRREEKLWEGSPDRPVSAFNALCAAPDGLLYCTVTGGDSPELVVFDPAARTFVGRLALPAGGPLDNGLQVGPDGALYGFTTSSVYRLDPGTGRIDTLLSRGGEFSVAGPVIGNHLYYGREHELKAVELFTGNE